MAMYGKRRDKDAGAQKDIGCDGLVLNAGPSLTCLSGLHFQMMERPVVFLPVAGQRPCIFLSAPEHPAA
jgi:hypothetical protein